MSIENITIGNLELSNEIVIGKLNKNKTEWTSKKEITVNALFAVAKHIENFGKPVILRNGVMEYTLTLEKLKL